MDYVFDSLEESVLETVSSRKRLRKPANSARNKEKYARYAKLDQLGKLNCDHSAKAFCQAKRLSVLDIEEVRGRLYSTCVKAEKDALLNGPDHKRTSRKCLAHLFAPF